MASYLDKTGLAYLWNKIKTYVDDHSSGGATLDKIYPLGSIYMSVDSRNPSTFFGGTWVAWGAGRVPVGVSGTDAKFDVAELEGGSADAVVVSHTHSVSGTAASSGAHTHQLGRNRDSVASGSKYNRPDNASSTTDRGYTSTSSGAHTHHVTGTAAAPSKSVSGTGKNLQPYITCYMWKRQA